MFYVPPKAWGNVIQLDPRAHICSRNSLSSHHPSQRKFHGRFPPIRTEVSRMFHDAHCDQRNFDTALGLHPNDPRDRSSMEALIRNPSEDSWEGGIAGENVFFDMIFLKSHQKKRTYWSLTDTYCTFFLEGGLVDPTKSHFVALQFAIINFCLLPQRVPAGSEGIRTLCAGLHGWSH